MTLPPCSVSAVIPSRGDVDCSGIVARLRACPEIDDIEIVVGDSVFNRYLGAGRAQHHVVYSQDDDCLTDAGAVIAAYRPGVIVNAMTPEHAAQYPGRITLVGFGAIFDRDLIRCLDDWERDELFLRECDRVFTALNQCEFVFPEIEILPRASDARRLWRQPEHLRCRAEIERRISERWRATTCRH